MMGFIRRPDAEKFAQRGVGSEGKGRMRSFKALHASYVRRLSERGMA